MIQNASSRVISRRSIINSLAVKEPTAIYSDREHYYYHRREELHCWHWWCWYFSKMQNTIRAESCVLYLEHIHRMCAQVACRIIHHIFCVCFAKPAFVEWHPRQTWCTPLLMSLFHIVKFGPWRGSARFKKWPRFSLLSELYLHGAVLCVVYSFLSNILRISQRRRKRRRSQR